MSIAENTCISDVSNGSTSMGYIETFYNQAILGAGYVGNYIDTLNNATYYINYPVYPYAIVPPTVDVPISLTDIDLSEPVYVNPSPIPDPYFPFEFNESFYQSFLQDAVQAKLLHDVLYGGTGLNADIEAAMMARETERDNLLLQEAIDKISNEWSKRRFALPNGVLAANIRRVYTEWQNTRLDKSRKIAEESEKIAIENTRWANDSGINLEKSKIDYIGGYWNRTLDGKKATVNAGVQVFDSFVKKFVGTYEGWKAESQAYEAKAHAAAALWGAEVGIINAKVDIEKTKGEFKMRAGELNIGQNKNASDFKATLITSAAQVASHVVAGALSALHASVGFSESVGDSTSRSCNYGESWSDNTSHDPDIHYSDNTSRQDGISYTDHTAHDADIDKTRKTHHTSKDEDIESTHKSYTETHDMDIREKHLTEHWSHDETAKDLRSSTSSSTNLNYNHYYEEE